MPRFDGRELLDLAARLADEGDEAALRSAISRAYYGVFLAHVEDVAQTAGIDPHDLKHYSHGGPGHPNHQPGLIDYISKTYGDELLQDLAQSLYERRICADYRVENPARMRQGNKSMPIDANTTATALAEASEIFRRTGK